MGTLAHGEEPTWQSPLPTGEGEGEGETSRLARLGYTAGVIRFGGAYSPLAIDNSAVIPQVERSWGPLDDILDRWAAVRPYMLDLADEARVLMLNV